MNPGFVSETKERRLVLAVLALLTAVYLLLAVLTSYSAWDSAAIWAAKGYGISLEGNIYAGETWGSHGLSYPLNIPILIGSFLTLAGDPASLSKTIFPLFLASMVLGMYSGWRRMEVPGYLAALGALFISTTPLVVDQGTNGYANLPLTAYLALGAILISDGFAQERIKSYVVGGTMLGLASWTRVEGLFFAVAVVVGLSAVAVVRRKMTLRIVWSAVPFLLISGAWVIFYLQEGSSGSEAMNRYSDALQSWAAGDFGLHSLRLIFGYMRRYMFNFKLWGAYFATLIPMSILSVIRIFREQRIHASGLLLAGTLTAVVSVMLFYVASFGNGMFLQWLIDSFPRALLPPVILIWYWVIISAPHNFGDYGLPAPLAGIDVEKDAAGTP